MGILHAPLVDTPLRWYWDLRATRAGDIKEMIDTPQSAERKLKDIIQRERQLTLVIIDAAQDLKAVAGDPNQYLLEAARNLERAIAAYYREVPRD